MRALILILMTLTVAAACAEKTTRRHLKSIPAEVMTTTADSVTPRQGDVAIAGYSKPLNSTKESFFVTNHTADTITSLSVRIDYSDMTGRQLHSVVSRDLPCMIPPGETRIILKPSWDKQHIYFYHLGKQPRTAGVTPYQVKITALKLGIIR